MSEVASPVMATGSSPLLETKPEELSNTPFTSSSSTSSASPSTSSAENLESTSSSSSSQQQQQQSQQQQQQQPQEENLPSTSQDPYPSEQHRSPALAQSVPSSHEATSPPEAAAGNQPQPERFYYFTTDMANQAMEDIEREKGRFDTLLQWYRCRKEEEIASLGTSRGNSHASSSGESKEVSTPMNGFQYSPHLQQPGLGDGGPGSVGPKIGSDEQVELDDISPSFLECMDVKPVLKRKLEDGLEGVEAKQVKIENMAAGPSEHNPLRKLEMMSVDFNSSNTINDVVESSSSSKKDERAAKLEKLEDIGKSIEDEMRGLEAARKMAAAGQNFPSPGQYPGMPGYPGMHGMPGPFSTGSFPGGPYPGAAPYGYPFTPGMPPGYPMSAPGKMPFQSPSFPGPMPPGAMPGMPPGAMPGMPPGMPPGAMPGRMPMHPAMMNPQHPYFAQMHAHHMAQMAKAGGMSPGGSMLPGGARHSPIQSPFPPGHPAHQNAAAYHQHMMMMRGAMPGGMPPGASPYGFPGANPMNPMMCGPPMHPGHPGMMNPMNPMNPAHQNSMLMLARDGSSAGMAAGWHPQLTPHYPPSSFPGAAGTPGPSHRATPSAAATPGK